MTGALSPLEVASGLVFGFAAPEELPQALEVGTPLEALERAILPALLRPPCLVSFSGGRDSSTILAAAVRLARREGLELPVPATNRFPVAEGSQETEWQEQVVIHLGLTDWVRFEFTDELDNVGPVAARVLLHHGLLWPFNAHFHAPLLDEAFGGSLLTGVGGDEALGIPRWARAAAVLSGRAQLRPRDILALGLAFSPPFVRRAVLSRRDPVLLPWLRPAAQREVWSQWVAGTAGQPVRWERRFAWWRGTRYLKVGMESLARLACDLRVEVHHPFVDACFSAAIAALPAEDRFLNRTQAMRSLFGDLLPEELLSRRTKSAFDEAFWSTHSRAFAAGWDGRGVDEELIDPVALKRLWDGPAPDARTFLLLQSLWLVEQRAGLPARELEQAVGGVG
ncbi:MAG TPA: asparagine synthase-related protein [Gaiellaceae bacterium]